MEEHGHQALLEGLLGHELHLLLELPLYLLVERFYGVVRVYEVPHFLREAHEGEHVFRP